MPMEAAISRHLLRAVFRIHGSATLDGFQAFQVGGIRLGCPAMEDLMAISAGIGLAAACGFRVFVPLFIASLAANPEFNAFGEADFQAMLGVDFEWLGNTPVTVALGVATFLEIGSYYIPWLDNALDAVASPAAVVAGTFVSGATMPDFMGDGSFKWIASTIAGGGTAGLVQGASVLTRGGSTATTGGVGNPGVSTAELGGSVLTTILAILVPIVAGILVLLILFFVIRTIVRYFKRRSARKKEEALAESVNRAAKENKRGD